MSTSTSGKGDSAPSLQGVRVVEVADEQAEYCGLLLAGLGADVIKVEPPGGSSTRRIGPFLDDQPAPDRSLYFWQYNRGKRSIVLDLDRPEDAARFRTLTASADVLLDSTSKGYLERLGLSLDAQRQLNPGLVTARVTPFGDDGPWSHWKGSDLVHLALGGPMMNCGYDPQPNGHYDLPPIAPQMWHSYHVVGEQLAMAIVAALLYRRRSGEGQHLTCAVHEAVAKSTEADLMSWVMRAADLQRQTCRHAMETVSPTPTISRTKDGRWIITNPVTPANADKLINLLAPYGMAAPVVGELERRSALSPQTSEVGKREIPGTGRQDEFVYRCQESLHRLFGKFTYDEAPWREAQVAGLLTAPVRKPHESLQDEHWIARKTFADVPHPELGRSFTYATSKWISTEYSWVVGRRAPLVGEDTTSILEELPQRSPATTHPRGVLTTPAKSTFALEGVRILDFSWFLASAGGTRFLTALGAECLKVEWRDRPDTRMGAMAPVGGREARRRATGPLPPVDDPDMGGQFNNKNPGKRGISLNVRDPRGLEIARRLVTMSDIVAEGFSPGVLDRWGLGYGALQELKPDIIYAQQSGMGAHGVYGRFRSVGPVAAAFAGTSEMSGLPEPGMPAGWGYSYLDWLGAYSFSLAMVAALHHRDVTGRGQWIDASQCEAGIFAAGTTYLDWSANGRVWQRYGNRSPYKPAAPHAAFRCAGEDRWVAIACFEQAEWLALCRAAEREAWSEDPRFLTLEDRLKNQDALEAKLSAWTTTQDAFQIATCLQDAGVPAGVCQTAADRCDRDPQLAHLEWLTEVTGTKIGRWPIAEVPVRMSATPATVGGTIGRGAPCYGEDNEYVYGELLGMTTREISGLAADGVI